MKNASVASKGVGAKKCAIRAFFLRSWSSSVEHRKGVYTPIAMERVRKRLKRKGLQAPIVQKSAEAFESKGLE
jgi:hypothetical protein